MIYKIVSDGKEEFICAKSAMLRYDRTVLYSDVGFDNIIAVIPSTHLVLSQGNEPISKAVASDYRLYMKWLLDELNIPRLSGDLRKPREEIIEEVERFISEEENK